MKIIFTVILLFFWSSISAQIRPEYSGMWYNPDQDGHGLSLEVLDSERSAGFWYRYDENGEPEWWLLQGTNHPANGEFGPHMKLEAYCFHGMIPGVWDPATKTGIHVTDVLVEFHDCNNITVYDVWAAPAIDMIRLTHISGLECSNSGVIKMPVTLEDIAREPWNMTFLDTELVMPDLVIGPDGTFRFGGGMMLCGYDAQITVDETDSSLLHFTITDSNWIEFCQREPYGSPIEGRFYENYYLCYPNIATLEEHCSVMKEAMAFPTSEDKAILFWRNEFED
jgi:hypothetical protein